MRVAAERDVCVGAGMCVMSAPAVFDQDDEGVVVLLVDEPAGPAAAAAREAVRLCPSGSLSIVED
ncbi:MAG: (4Fe-4S)-binding protein [Pseudonocardiales bacterium]|nr:(4Fe-4S)-binding protein [Pseudonocardiales bacterium]